MLLPKLSARLEQGGPLRARLTAEGRTSVSALVQQGGAGEEFAATRGAERVLPRTAYVQDVRAVVRRPSPRELSANTVLSRSAP
ncbi:hypothetical protein AB0D04_42565, partial [Streptomyces sp. NPDC048483]|uniref:hypothetical protein n=1 Tax=Streptomyces sp. NPDC048483 TaxID=3154927 RepID=UPI0034304F7A